MFGKKKNVDTPAVEKAVSQGVSFELTLADRSRRSEKRAWIVAWVAVIMSMLLAGGYMLVLPLKEKVPYLVMADPYTGTATVGKLVTFGQNDVTAQEAINKSNVAQFILSRESYDSGLVGNRNWRTTLSMAGPSVAPAYMALHNAVNPQRPYNLYGATKAVHVRILSIVLLGGGQGQPPRGATVRFQRSVYDKATARSQPLDSKIATMEFTYDKSLRLQEQDRLLNPLGFRVTNYRVDNDFGAAPPPVGEFESSALPTTVPAAQPSPDGVGPGLVPGGAVPAPGAPAIQNGTVAPGADPTTGALPAMPAEQMNQMNQTSQPAGNQPAAAQPAGNQPGGVQQ